MNIFGISISKARAKARVTELDGVRLTPAQQLQYQQAEHSADQMMSAITWTKNLAWLILIIVMAVSYEDQERYFEKIGMGHFASILIPFVFDAATVLCVKVIGTFAMLKMAKIIALSVVVFPVSASAFINVQASPTVKVAIVYVLVVALIPAIELIKAFIGADFSKMRGIESNLLSSVVTDVVSDEELVRKQERGRKIAEGRKRAQEKRDQEAAEAAEIEEQERKERRERGLKAAAARQRAKEERDAAAAAAAAAAIRPPRVRKPMHPVAKIAELQDSSLTSVK